MLGPFEGGWLSAVCVLEPETASPTPKTQGPVSVIIIYLLIVSKMCQITERFAFLL